MSLPNNTLPNTDPATGGTPYFQDNTFVRGDQQRANNQRIWANEAALLANDQFLDAQRLADEIAIAVLKMTPMANLRLSLSGNTLTLTGLTGSLSASNPGYILMRSTATAGLLVPVTITADISMTLPSSTANQRICGINTTDGQATYAVNGSPNNGITNAIEWFANVLYDFTSSTPYLGLCKSPMHTTLLSPSTGAADYLYGLSATTVSAAGNGATVWDAMVTSNSTTFGTPGSVGCVCIGPALTSQISGGSSNAGWWSSMAIQNGYAPMWNHRIPKVKSDFYSDIANASSVTYGSTDTYIKKLGTIQYNNGDKLQYFSAGGTLASGGIGGAEFYCAVSGYYSFNYADNFGGSAQFGLSLNSSSRTTGISSQSAGYYLSSQTTSAANAPDSCGTGLRYFNAGDIVRPHANNASFSSGSGHQSFIAEFLGFELS